MSKYYLNAYLNDEPIGTLKEGQLLDIDNYIIENKINGVGDLYNQIKSQLKNRLVDANIEFVIEYKKNNEIKTIPLFFNHELSFYRNYSNREQFIYKKMCENEDFKKIFEYNFINQLVEAPTNSKIYRKVKDYFDNFNEHTFSNLYNSLVINSNKPKLEPKDFDTISEYEESLEIKTYKYKEQRNMFFSAYFFSKDLPKTNMLISKLSKDREEEMLSDYNLGEFEEQMNFDRNPDDGYRLYGKKVSIGETNSEATDETNYKKL